MSRPIGWWLLLCAGMTFVMVILGGLTRLTHSGLSMVEWHPLSVLPPIGQAAWEAAFAAYRHSPEYLKINAPSGMDLAGYKQIFWLEFIHRNWGRAIGVVFGLPFLWFLLRGRITRGLAPRLFLLFLLGGLQGALGWFMVASGLVDRPAVSHFRLAAHFGAALLIYGALLWVALGLLWPPAGVAPEAARRLRPKLMALLGLIVVTMLAGSLVAGLHAGLIDNTFPLMEGRWIPPGPFDPFNGVTSVQFDHRLLAETVLAAGTALWFRARRLALPARARLALDAMLAIALIQVGLGIATLLLVVPLGLAALHQAGAMTLFSATLWALHETRASYAARASVTPTTVFDPAPAIRESAPSVKASLKASLKEGA